MKNSKGYAAAALIAFAMVFGFDKAGSAEPGMQVLSRGPVHEAFANVVVFDPEPGVVFPKTLPDRIEEIPPDQRPAGNNITWIPGYWAWDDERNDYLWVSGVWRALPPGRQWVPGYWEQSDRGFQWVSGYWADAAIQQPIYLPAPPANLEEGPNIAAPSDEYVWAPGHWNWYQGRYAWQPGSWVVGQPDREWYPDSYVWTPSGYVFVDGYWDYSVDRRGVLFAPVYFEPSVYERQDYQYSPNIVVALAGLLANLFQRPSYDHYYFGDYYDDTYRNQGFYYWSYPQSGRYRYDPIYEQQRWEYRRDREWRNRLETLYQYRRDHEEARPWRTWESQRSISTREQSNDNNLVIVVPLNQLQDGRNSPIRFQQVDREERQRIVQRSQEIRKSRGDRRTVNNPQRLEEKPAPSKGKPAENQAAEQSLKQESQKEFKQHQARQKASQEVNRQDEQDVRQYQAAQEARQEAKQQDVRQHQATQKAKQEAKQQDVKQHQAAQVARQEAKQQEVKQQQAEQKARQEAKQQDGNRKRAAQDARQEAKQQDIKQHQATPKAKQEPKQEPAPSAPHAPVVEKQSESVPSEVPAEEEVRKNKKERRGN